MSQEPLVRESQKVQTLRQSSKKSSKSVNQMPLCMCVSREKDGQNQDVTTLRMVPGALLGGYMMHSFGESPSRRKRIALVADFGGLTAPEILFERKGVSGNTDQSKEKREKLPEELEKALKEQSYLLTQ